MLIKLQKQNCAVNSSCQLVVCHVLFMNNIVLICFSAESDFVSHVLYLPSLVIICCIIYLGLGTAVRGASSRKNAGDTNDYFN